MAPVFLRDPNVAIEAAHIADESGIDGVFSYDHLFPIHFRDRPALAAIPMLAAMACRTRLIQLGTLVCRVTMVPVPVLVDSLATLDELSGHRVIGGIGTGDRLTEAENEAYGTPFPPLKARLEMLLEAARGLRARHVETWIGGRSREVRALAAAEAEAWNTWDGPLEELTAFATANVGAGAAIATWGGPPPADGNFADHLQRLAEAGAGWAIYGPAPEIDWTAFVTKLAGAAKGLR
ncbi:MAG: LLM class flavin-dependent oxidoreductase [Acidimicrobiales bacterium]